MTYQELINCYPWIDLAWEVFKGVSPTAIALVTIFVTEFFVRKRNKVNKRREMELQYLEKILTWIHETRRNVFEISSSLSKVLLMRNRPDRMPKFNEVLGKMTEMNKSIFILSDTYKEISSCMGYDFKLDQFKEAIHCYCETINDIGVKYINFTNTENALEEINSITAQTRETIKASSSLLALKISLLYGKRKCDFVKLVGYIGEKLMFKKKKLYTPYGFNEEVEYEIYSQIGEVYRETVLGEKAKKQDKNFPSFNTYLEWKEYFINKFFRSCDWNCNFTHYLNRKRRTNEKKVDLIKCVAVPIYIGEISCLITIYQLDKEQISICTQIIMLLSAIIITVIASFWLIYKYSSRTQFYMDCIGIMEEKYTGHQN